MTTWWCERVYVDGSVPNFTADVPGSYVVQVEARRGEERSSAIATLRAHEVSREAGAEGCSSASGAPAALIAALVVLRRRSAP